MIDIKVGEKGQQVEVSLSGCALEIVGELCFALTKICKADPVLRTAIADIFENKGVQKVILGEEEPEHDRS